MGAGKILKNFATQLLVQNLWNFASEQRSGMTFILSSRSKRRIVVRPPGESVNTNPYLASFLTGVIVRESHRKGVEGIKSLLESGLAAQADDLYWRVLRPTALLAGLFLVLLGQPLAGLCVFLLGFNILAQGERLVGYARGLKMGKKGLSMVLASMARTRSVLAPFAGGLMGIISAMFVFNLDRASAAFSVNWFVFAGFFTVSMVFAVLRISPLFNLLTNLVLVVILGMFI